MKRKAASPKRFWVIGIVLLIGVSIFTCIYFLFVQTHNRVNNTDIQVTYKNSIPHYDTSQNLDSLTVIFRVSAPQTGKYTTAAIAITENTSVTARGAATVPIYLVQGVEKDISFPIPVTTFIKQGYTGDVLISLEFCLITEEKGKFTCHTLPYIGTNSDTIFTIGRLPAQK